MAAIDLRATQVHIEGPATSVIEKRRVREPALKVLLQKKNLLKVSGSGALDTDVQKSDLGVKWPNEVKRGAKTRPTMV